jgi:hypothetical protein
MLPQRRLHPSTYFYFFLLLISSSPNQENTNPNPQIRKMKPTSKPTKKKVTQSLKKLEYLSLVSKVCTELESHLGFTDKVLAEFITDLGRKCLTHEEFDQKLKQNGADLPDYFVRTLLTIIHAILAAKVKKSKGIDSDRRRDRGGRGLCNQSFRRRSRFR